MPDFNDQGCIHNPAFVEEVVSQMTNPFFASAAPSAAGSGKNKLILLHKNYQKLKIPHPKPLQTTVGDCFNPSSLVNMADGSKKRLDEVAIGELVVTPFGNIKRVLSTFKKPYSKKMLRIKVQGFHRPLVCTPDHNLVECTSKHSFEWASGDSLEKGRYILIPKLPNIDGNKTYDLLTLPNLVIESVDDKTVRQARSTKLVNRFVELNEKMFWLFGIFLAEGSVDYSNSKFPNRITFNLSSKEIVLAKKIQNTIKELFGLDSTITQVPSKPTVLYVRLSSAIFATFIKQYCFGNVWNKSFKEDFKVQSYSNKLALLNGWIEGDGYKSEMGVTTSKQLAEDFFDIANSCGMNARFETRKAYKQSKESYAVHCNANTKTLATKKFTFNQNFVTKLGKAAKIISIEEVEPETDHVYCIEVEDDNAFICDGYAVHNCVSHACATALDYLCVTEIANGEREKWISRTASEFIYSNGRVIVGKGRLGGGDGSLNAWTLKAMKEYGTLIRQKYGKVDLTEYSPSRARTWGNTKVPTTLLDISKDYFITGYKLISSFEEAMDALASDCPIVVASNQGFTKKRDKDGFCSPSGSWSHSMAVIGGDSTGRRPGVAILNSWPGYLSGPNPYELPESAFFCDADVFNKMAKSYGDTFALFGFNGYKLQIDSKVWT